MITEIEAEIKWKNSAELNIENYNHNNFKKYESAVYGAIIKAIRAATI